MIDQKKIQEVAEYLLGTCKSLTEAIAAFSLGDCIDECRLEAALLEEDTELCVQCQWWHEVHQLKASEEHGGGLCCQCCEELNIEFDE